MENPGTLIELSKRGRRLEKPQSEHAGQQGSAGTNRPRQRPAHDKRSLAPCKPLQQAVPQAPPRSLGHVLPSSRRSAVLGASSFSAVWGRPSRSLQREAARKSCRGGEGTASSPDPANKKPSKWRVFSFLIAVISSGHAAKEPIEPNCGN